MKPYNTDVYTFLRNHPNGIYTTNQLVRLTKRSFTTVRETLNRMRDNGIMERDLDMGSAGKTIYRWYWTIDPDEEL